jgi:hypothetical protein
VGWRSRMAGGTGTLVAGKYQQLGVDEQQFGNCFLKVSARLDPWADRVEPVGRHGLDTLLAAGHKREGPERMAVSTGAMTGRLPAAAVRKRERARKSIRGDLEAGHQPSCTAAETGGIRTARRRDVGAISTGGVGADPSGPDRSIPITVKYPRACQSVWKTRRVYPVSWYVFGSATRPCLRPSSAGQRRRERMRVWSIIE